MTPYKSDNIWTWNYINFSSKKTWKHYQDNKEIPRKDFGLKYSKTPPKVVNLNHLAFSNAISDLNDDLPIRPLGGSAEFFSDNHLFSLPTTFSSKTSPTCIGMHRIFMNTKVSRPALHQVHCKPTKELLYTIKVSKSFWTNSSNYAQQNRYYSPTGSVPAHNYSRPIRMRGYS